MFLMRIMCMVIIRRIKKQTMLLINNVYEELLINIHL